MPKHRFLILLVLCFLSLSSRAFQYELTSENEKLGLFETSDSTQILANEYEAIGWESTDDLLINGVFKAKQNERWALFDSKGKRLTAHEYVTLQPFKDNKFIASKRSSSSILQVYGLINKKGKSLIPFDYLRIEPDGSRLITIKQQDKNYFMGVFDEYGKTLIAEEFRDIKALSKGYYAVQGQGQALALYDSTGNAISDFVFQDIKLLEAGQFEVSYYNRKGVIDTQGKVLVPPVYKSLSLTKRQITAQAFTQWTYFSKENTTTFQFDDIHALGDSILLVATNDNLGTINTKESYKIYLERHDLVRVNDNFAIVENLDNHYYGVINAAGQLILPTIYDDIQLSEDYILAKIDRTNGENWFAFNHNGQKLNTIGYEEIVGQIGNYTIVSRQSKQALLDVNGRELTPFAYAFEDITPEGLLIVKSSNGIGVLNQRGLWLITPYKDKIIYTDGVFYFEQGSANGFIDKEGKQLARSYDDIALLPMGYAKRVEEGFTLFNSRDSLLFDYTYDTVYALNNKHWYMERDELKFFYRPEDERVFPLPEAIDSLQHYEEGYIAFLKDGQWGFLDEMGQLRISNRYEAVGHFSEALAAVKLIGKWGVINRAEELVVQPKYDSISPFYNALAIVGNQNQYGLIDRTGRIVLAPQYDEMIRHPKWIALVKDDKIGVSDIRGRLIKSPQYDEVQALDEGHFLVRKGLYYGVIDLFGRDVAPISFEKIFITAGGFLGVQPAQSKTFELK